MLVEKKIHNDILHLPKQCYDSHVDKCAFQNIFNSDFSAFSKKGSHLNIALISKRFEPQGWDWSQIVELSKQFLNLTNFSYLSLLEVYLSLIIGERRVLSQVVVIKTFFILPGRLMELFPLRILNTFETSSSSRRKMISSLNALIVIILPLVGCAKGELEIQVMLSNFQFEYCAYIVMDVIF